MTTEIIITELSGFQSSGYICGRGNTRQGHNPFSWSWDDGKINVLIDGYSEPTVTKQQVKTALLKQLKKEKYLS